MSDSWDLLVAGSTIPSGDAWTLLNNLGGGAGIGQVVSDLEGTVMHTEELQGVVESVSLTGIIDDNILSGEITFEDISGEVLSEDAVGGIECP